MTAAEPGAAQPGDTRRCIIGAVLRIIGRDGVAAVTNRRIAKEAGVSLGSVTYHFATQHDLLRESLLRFVDEETRRFTALADDSRLDRIGLAEAAALVGQVAGGTEFDSEHIAPFELYVQAGRDERLRAAAAECFAAYDRLAARILTALGVADAERLAGTVVALVAGQQLRRLATGSSAADLVDALLLLAKGAAPTAAAPSAPPPPGPVSPAGR
ncbi:TetR family transcriptional regulator [Streptomyces sp. WAC 06725]|uniref:TetR/AcrR family transcriptional regulator n=1 Tax=Streptomyces sp. WAC 06725 TaxID=2203209 RepID=UPI000F745BAF|nr:TetR/AcrR family transcriptional regulator [Streptomyces sp. WAC 06725]RSO25585.1 TetR family transcriptional regulator [Streptomyces sp. WAC 06725]